MYHKVHVFAGLKTKCPQETNILLHIHLQHGHLAQITPPHHYLKFHLKVQNNLVLNLVTSAHRGLKPQLNISVS